MNAQTFRDIATLMIRVHCHACGNVHWFKAGDGHLLGPPSMMNRAA